VKAVLIRHLQNALGALGQLSRQPVSTALTIAVIGIALALPAGLQVLVQGAQRFAGSWQEIRDFSVYLRPGTALAQAKALAEELDKRAVVEAVRVIAANEALADFRADPTFGDALKVLEDNPLPHTLVIRPDAAATTTDLDALRSELSARDDVDLVQLDTQWLSRLAAILDLVRRGVWFTAVLLAGAVIVIVGNTIRLDIQNRRREIEVSKLLGASDAFVRRPFLYIGAWYGILGGLLAVVVLSLGLLLLGGPLSRLLALYGGQFTGFGVDLATIVLVFGAGLLTGWTGAWVAVARHLSAIEPRV
jgi:cell division transport system permease protein